MENNERKQELDWYLDKLGIHSVADLQKYSRKKNSAIIEKIATEMVKDKDNRGMMGAINALGGYDIFPDKIMDFMIDLEQRIQIMEKKKGA